jgi:signal transduction histidine kinase
LGGAICLQVADTGIGMTADEVGIALTKFGQVEGGLDRKREGTGLGLPLAKAQVELHGGDLSITSQPMGGTTVTIRFPPERTIGRALAGGTGSPVGISAA